jgi:hypothetical protein
MCVCVCVFVFGIPDKLTGLQRDNVVLWLARWCLKLREREREIERERFMRRGVR